MYFLSCVCFVFVHICLFVLSGHLLGKGWYLGSSLWCLIVSLSLSHWYLGQVWYLIVSIPDLCTHTSFCDFVVYILKIFLGVIRNPSSFHYFIFKLCIIIVYTLTMCNLLFI